VRTTVGKIEAGLIHKHYGPALLQCPFSGMVSVPLSSAVSTARHSGLPAIRFLQALSEGFEQAAYMRRVVSDPKFPLDHLSHPLARPYISSKTARWRSLGQKLGHFGALLLTQARWRSGSRLAL
jgi:hypothetical protein